MKKKAQVTIYIAWIFAAIFIIVLTGVIAPMGTKFNLAMYKAGEKILNSSLNDIDGIQDTAIKEHLNTTITNAKSATQDNIDITSNMFQYSWLFVLALGAIIAFLYTRRMIEVGQGGFV